MAITIIFFVKYIGVRGPCFLNHKHIALINKLKYMFHSQNYTQDGKKENLMGIL